MPIVGLFESSSTTNQLKESERIKMKKLAFAAIALVLIYLSSGLYVWWADMEVQQLARQREWKNPVDLTLNSYSVEWWRFINGGNDEWGKQHYHPSTPPSVSRFYDSLRVPFDIYVEDPEDDRTIAFVDERRPAVFGIDLDREMFEILLADVRLELGRQAVADLMKELRESRCTAPCQDVISPAGQRDYVALGNEINSILVTTTAVDYGDDRYLFSDAERDIWRAETRALVAEKAAQELVVLYTEDDDLYFYGRDKAARIEVVRNAIGFD